MHLGDMRTDCRRCGALDTCARLRTIGEAGVQVTHWILHPAPGQAAPTDCATYRTRETRKARKDAMPHERGILPVLPSEFLCPLSPIPKLALMLARQPLAAVNRSPVYPVDPQALNYSRHDRSGALGTSPVFVRSCALSLIPRRVSSFASSHFKQQKRTERRATIIVARL